MQLDDTLVLARAQKEAIARRIRAGLDVSPAETLALHKLEVALANARAVEEINEITRKGAGGKNGSPAKARRPAKARG